MSDRPRLLDLFCGSGGAAEGYRRAGFDVVGVDTVDRGFRPGEFVQADALEYLDAHGHEFAAVAASPPCFEHSSLAALSGDSGTGWLLAATIERLQQLGRPYVVENVAGAHRSMPGALKLCGSEFGLGARCRDGVWRRLERHRLFLSDVFLMGAGGCAHGRAPVIGVYGDGAQRGIARVGTAGGDPYRGNLAESREALGIEWMTRKQLSLSIPPAYTQHIGEQLLAAIREDLAA